VDLLLREEYGLMPVMSKICTIDELQEFNCGSIDMSSIGNNPLPIEYFDKDKFTFTPAYNDFLKRIIGAPKYPIFSSHFPKVNPEND